MLLLYYASWGAGFDARLTEYYAEIVPTLPGRDDRREVAAGPGIFRSAAVQHNKAYGPTAKNDSFLLHFLLNLAVITDADVDKCQMNSSTRLPC